MTQNARELTPAQRGRRRYLIAVLVGWVFVDVFDGLAFPAETVEHWVEAAFWAAAALGYAALARRRPLPAEHRLGDWAIAATLVLVGVTMGLRATLPDAAAFRWTMGMTAAYLAVVWLGYRRMRGRTGVPANESPS